MSSINPAPESEKPDEDKPISTFAFEQMPAPGTNPATVVNPEKHGFDVAPVVADSGASASVWNRLFPVDVISEEGVQQPIPDPKGIQLDHFVLEERIGIGGMGSVFRAIDERLERVVALKILSPAQTRDPGSIMRFRNEAKAAARLDHDNIARVFYIGEDSGLNFIAFEYVTGTNIRDLIRRYGQMDPAEAINYTLQVAYALKHTSAASVVHRDIKPSNIIITTSGRAKLVDLGLARKENADSFNEITVAGTTLGTFDYISPEQAKDPRNVDVRSDIYSLGCTLYHMLTGTAPYPEGTMMQKLLNHQESDPPNPSDKNRNVSPGLAAIVQRMMASEPRYRFQSADELIHSLLLVAGSYGMKGVNPEGLIWKASQTPAKRFWEGNLGWLTTVVLLLIIVFSINKFQPTSPVNPNENLAVNGTGTGEPGIIGAPESSNKSLPSNLLDDPLLKSNPSDETTPVSPLGPDENSTDSPADEATKKIFKEEPSPLTDEIIGTVPDTFNSNNKNEPGVKDENPLTKPAPNNVTTRPVEVIKIALTSSPGAKPQSFQTVESALAAADDGSVIELNYNGSIGKSSEKFWKLNNKKITIRAGESYHPVIKFNSESITNADETGFISVTGGSLELFDLDLSFQINGTQSNWDLFKLTGPDKLRLTKVSVVVNSSPVKKVSLVSLTKINNQIPVENSIGKGPNSSINPVEVRLKDCFIKGNCQLFSARHTMPALLNVEGSILAIQGPVMHLYGDNNMPMQNHELILNLEHVTCLVQNGLIQVDTGDLPRSVLPINVSARNNIFATQDNQPLVSMTGNNSKEEFRDLLTWSGEKNFYEKFLSFWYIQPKGITDNPESLNFANWNQLWKGSITSPMQDQIIWKNDWKDKELIDIRAADLELGTGDLLEEEKTPVWRASDQGNVGAELLQFFNRPYEETKNPFFDTEEEVELSPVKAI